MPARRSILQAGSLCNYQPPSTTVLLGLRAPSFRHSRSCLVVTDPFPASFCRGWLPPPPVVCRCCASRSIPTACCRYERPIVRFRRPAPERPIFGILHNESSENSARTLDVKPYLARYGDGASSIVDPAGANLPTAPGVCMVNCRLSTRALRTRHHMSESLMRNRSPWRLRGVADILRCPGSRQRHLAGTHALGAAWAAAVCPMPWLKAADHPMADRITPSKRFPRGRCSAPL